MPRGSSDLTNRRKEEIVDACEKLYREKGFHDITIKDISRETSMSRPSILQTAVLRREAVSFDAAVSFRVEGVDRFCPEGFSRPQNGGGMRRIVNLIGRELGLEGDARPVAVGQSLPGAGTAGQVVPGVHMNRRPVGEYPKTPPGNGIRQNDRRGIRRRFRETERVIDAPGTAVTAIVIV